MESHKKILQKALPGNLEICQLNKTELYNKTDREGYHFFGNNWWQNPECPYALKYLSVEELYPDDYYTTSAGHPGSTEALQLYDYMQSVYQRLFNRQFTSVLEFGAGAGEITRVFESRKLDYTVVEANTAAINKLCRFIPSSRILRYNLKFMPFLLKSFEMVMCTEIAEHIEIPFASKIVEVCLQHSPLVWFSAADKNRPAHYHHMNEQPIEFWDNLFAHMGASFYIKLNEMHSRASRLYIADALGGTLTK